MLACLTAASSSSLDYKLHVTVPFPLHYFIVTL